MDEENKNLIEQQAEETLATTTPEYFEGEEVAAEAEESPVEEKSYDTDSERVIRTVIERAEGVSVARFAGSAEEKKAAKELRDLFEAELKTPARLEPFDVHPLAGRQGLPVYGLIYLVSLIAFFFLPPLGLVLTVILGALLVIQIHFNGNFFNGLFPKRTSYNVVSVVEKDRRRTEKTIVLASHYDADYGRPDIIRGFAPDDVNKRYRNVCLAVVAGSIVLLFVMSLIRTIFHLGVAFTVVLCLIALITSGASIAYLCTYATYIKSGAYKSKSGLSGAGVALAVGKHFADNPEELPDNVRIIVAAFGSKNAGAKGSEQFVHTHWNKDDLLVNPVILNLDKLYTGDYQLISEDKLLNLQYDKELCDAVFASLEQGGYAPQTVKTDFKINDAVPFIKADLPAVTLRRQTAKNSRKRTEAEDLDEAYNAVLSVVKGLI